MLGFLNAGRAGCLEVGGGLFIPLCEICPLETTWTGDSDVSGPETPDSFRGPSGQGTSTAPHLIHPTKAGDSGPRDQRFWCGRRLRTPAETLSKRRTGLETLVTKGRILRPPGDSGHPPVILRRGIQYRTTHLAKGRKNQGPETPAWQDRNSGEELSCSNRTLPFLPFFVNDA